MEMTIEFATVLIIPIVVLFLQYLMDVEWMKTNSEMKKISHAVYAIALYIVVFTIGMLYIGVADFVTKFFISVPTFSVLSLFYSLLNIYSNKSKLLNLLLFIIMSAAVSSIVYNVVWVI